MARTYHGSSGNKSGSLMGVGVAVVVIALASGATAGASSGGAPPSAGSYSTASTKSLDALWLKAGGSQSSAQNAACHAMQESSGSATVTSSNPDGGTNVGVFQLDTKGVGAGYSVAQLSNALTNAQITVKATKDGQDWSSWATPGC